MTVYDTTVFVDMFLLFLEVWGGLFVLDIAIQVFRHYAEK